jgi:hypothetical protein
MPNQIDSYKKVIDVLASDAFQNYEDIKPILIQIAKTNPQVVVDAVDFLAGKPKLVGKVVSDRVIDLLYQGRKIEAIKQHRIDSGLGLKEAKDVVVGVIQNNRGLRNVFHRPL